MNLEELLNRIEPIGFDGFMPKSRFIKTLDEFPEFKESLEEQISLDSNQEWVNQAQRKKIYFIINDDSWKGTTSFLQNELQLNLIGKHYIPTISVNIHHKKSRS